MAFRWASYLGIGTMLFLASSGFELIIGVLATVLGFSPKIVGLSSGSDLAFYGKTSEELLSDPTVLGLRTHHIIVVGGLLVGLGVLGLGVTWFGLREGRFWSVPVLLVSELAMWPYWAMMIMQYTSAGVQVALVGDVQPFVVVPAVLVGPASSLSWLGLKRKKASRSENLP